MSCVRFDWRVLCLCCCSVLARTPLKKRFLISMGPFSWLNKGLIKKCTELCWFVYTVVIQHSEQILFVLGKFKLFVQPQNAAKKQTTTKKSRDLVVYFWPDSSSSSCMDQKQCRVCGRSHVIQQCSLSLLPELVCRYCSIYKVSLKRYLCSEACS